MPHIIEIRHVAKRFPGVLALDDVSFEVKTGSLHAICGENGAGKSTLMKLLAGVIVGFDGEIRLHGQPVQFTGTRDAERAGVSIIHQELNLVEQLSVAANVFLGRELCRSFGRLDERAMEAAAARLFVELECPIDPRARVGALRVGDQQLVEIAKALSLRAEVLIMDEPTSALTEAEVARLYRVIERLRQRGVTILYISHKMDEVFRLADRITILRDGRLVRTLECAETSPREVTHLMVGRELEATHFGARQPGETLLKVDQLALPWRGHARAWRLQNINFALRRGEILGVAGLMGAGRTELLEALFGASPERPQGQIVLDGQPVRFEHPADACRAGVALVTEDRKRLGLFDKMNVGQNISLCQLREAARGGWLSLRREAELAEQMAERMHVKTAGIGAAITSLSGGNQQKAIIGRWLLTRPKLLLLDDPTRGIDVGAKAELYRLLDELCRSGLGIIVTSSELPELLTLCDRIVVLCEGRLTGEFSRAEATEQRIMEAATNRVA
ncbi:MAG: sugar ABC transporter ATP-binding protein [Planctomycetes bacterium]|nr:sugar ABC transporter ATP-binding protein [Planctomycetota bacterium]